MWESFKSYFMSQPNMPYKYTLFELYGGMPKTIRVTSIKPLNKSERIEEANSLLSKEIGRSFNLKKVLFLKV